MTSWELISVICGIKKYKKSAVNYLRNYHKIVDFMRRKRQVGPTVPENVTYFI
jgi:hypothetical protein